MDRIKYPRTYHVPWSPGATSDDKVLTGDQVAQMFAGREVVVTEKMDGENCSIYSDGYTHARSVASHSDPTRDWVKALAARLSTDIPHGWRTCGENLYAKHSLLYRSLRSYFYLFGIYDGENVCLSWQDTVLWAGLLGLEVVPILYRGIWGEKHIRNLWTGASACGDEGEGYVIRLAGNFHLDHFTMSVVKWVRPNHVRTAAGRHDWFEEKNQLIV